MSAANAGRAPRSWWWTLFQANPEHVLIETFLVVAVLWIVLVKRPYDPRKR
jgi:hypothetical protein